MSQVGTARPTTQHSLTARLPQITHPLSRLTTPAELELRGQSRRGSDAGDVAATRAWSGRPLANEATYAPYRRSLHSSGSRLSRLSSKERHRLQPFVRYDSIPEGVEVALGDPNKTKLPIFGNRAEIGSRDNGGEEAPASRLSGRLSKASYASAQQRLEIDELEAIIKEKVKTSYHEMSKRFKDNDPEQKGNVSRDAFFRILVTVLNQPLTSSQFNRLMERLDMRNKQVISFSEFHAAFRDVPPSAEYPRWMDPIHRGSARALMTAPQVHMHLKAKAQQRVQDLVDLIPQCNPDGAGHILKPEFRNVLGRMGFRMNDGEFKKLWDKYDPEGYGTINGERMMKTLGVFVERGGFLAPSPPVLPEQQQEEEEEEREEGSGRKLKKKELERQRSLSVEKWLKNKFREGFKNMKQDFQQCDPQKTGLVTHEAFLKILAKYDLKLEKSYLADFLARCGVPPTHTDVPYREFLHRFQDRSESGMPHKILTDPRHKYNQPDTEPAEDAKSTISTLESQLMNMFQRDFLVLLGTFHNIDKLGLDYISQEEFRAAIESRFDLEVTDEQFRALLDRMPLDEEGNVKYADFMAQFDTRGKAKSLFSVATQQPIKYKSIGCLPSDPSPPPPPSEPVETQPDWGSGQPDHLVIENGTDEMMDILPRRSAQELFKVIKDLVKKDYQTIVEEFHYLDEKNTQRLTQEMMYQLLKRFDISPEITRGEIRELWRTFITNQDKTLDFIEFTRHFGHSPKSAAYSNAKLRPPVRGDSDCMMRSRKLNCARDMLHDSLRAKIDYMWEDLHREFVSMDPYTTGCITREEFREVMSELCVHLTNYELNLLTEKFDLKKDGRVSYFELLRPFAMRRQVWRHGNNMMSLLSQSQPELHVTDILKEEEELQQQQQQKQQKQQPRTPLDNVIDKIRHQLSCSWKDLRRSFKRRDANNEGLLPLADFRTVLKQANVALDEEEVYHLMTHFDKELSGKMPYRTFINDTLRPPGKCPSALSMRSATSNRAPKSGYSLRNSAYF